MIKAADCNIAGLRSVASGGEPLGAEMLEWARMRWALRSTNFTDKPNATWWCPVVRRPFL